MNQKVKSWNHSQRRNICKCHPKVARLSERCLWCSIKLAKRSEKGEQRVRKG